MSGFDDVLGDFFGKKKKLHHYEWHSSAKLKCTGCEKVIDYPMTAEGWHEAIHGDGVLGSAIGCIPIPA